MDGELELIRAWAAKPLSLAIVFVGTLRFLRWLIPFVFERMDVSRGELGKRLSHVEKELDRYREATMRLVASMAERDPSNPVLIDVSRILRSALPLVPDDDNRDLLDKLRAVE